MAPGVRWLFVLASVLAATADMSAAVATIDVAAARQTIRGFGGVDAWLPPLTDHEMDVLFGNTGPGEIGLSIYRVRIAPDGNWADEVSNAQKAAARGAIVIATPWSPPAEMKTNGNVVGGSLKLDAYGAYADYLNRFAGHMAAQGVPLFAISLQNEPDWDPDYEGCVWTPQNFLTFCRDYAGRVAGTRVIMPESLNFNHAMSDLALNDPVAAANIDIVGGHIYGGGLAPYPLAAAKGKEVWMTEHLELTTDWAGALTTAREIHDCLVSASYNAYLWWYLKRFYGPLDDSDKITKRGYVMAQFAKFVRPGAVRVEATSNPAPGVFVSAYRGVRTVIVAINANSADVSQTFALQGGSISSVTPWTTSSSASLLEQNRIGVSGGAFAALLPASSVTTLVENLPSDDLRLSPHPRSQAAAAGASVVLSAGVSVHPERDAPAIEWQRNGRTLTGATSDSLTLANFGSADAGLYEAVARSGELIVTSPPVLVGVESDGKISGEGKEVASDVRHANGNIFDQVLLTGAAETITADWPLHQVTRTSFVDLDGDIVQVEFSGPGALSLVLDAPTGPAPAEKYRQDVRYMRGHAGIVITGATEETNVAVFSVGRVTAVEQTLFRDGVDYDGVADIAFVAIASPTGKFGGVRTGNVNFFASRGLTGLYAPGVVFLGPVYLGNIAAFDAAKPVLQVGSAGDVRVTGGDFVQPNGQSLEIGGVAHLRFTDGCDSHGRLVPASSNHARLMRDGIDVTADVIAEP